MTDVELKRVEKAYRRAGSRWAWNAIAFARFQGWEPSLRRRTVAHLALRPGDSVLDVGCGRGSNFPYLQRAVGDEGRIVGLDYSATMLRGAEELTRKHGWNNVKLIQGDAAELDRRSEFDGAICTVAMTVIPRWQEALRRMAAAVQPGRRIAIMDGRPLKGVMRIGTPFARLFSRVVAADLERDVAGECRRLLADVREESRMFGVYSSCPGNRGPMFRPAHPSGSEDLDLRCFTTLDQVVGECLQTFAHPSGSEDPDLRYVRALDRAKGEGPQTLVQPSGSEDPDLRGREAPDV